MTPVDIARLLSSYRFPLADEKALQAEMLQVLRAHGVEAVREHRLGPGDVVDFMVGTVAIEAKIKGSARAIYRQCKRYCSYEEVSDLILATNVAMGVPAEILGKSTYVVNLGRAHL